MHQGEAFTIVVAVNDPQVLEQNLLRSPELEARQIQHQIILKQGYSSASLAYNSALDEAINDIVVFIHQDVFLPADWFNQVRGAIEYLENSGVNWGVLGSFGSMRAPREGLGRILTNGIGIHGNPIEKPESVDTLDEVVLILRRSSGLRFDPHLPHFHLYGTDICMVARRNRMTCFSIPAFCVHNTNQILVLPKEFWVCYEYLRTKWSGLLPIYTSCITISRFRGPKNLRRLREFVRRLLGKARAPTRRVADPRSLLT